MMSRLRIRPDVAAFAVLLSGLLVALALFTRDGADPPATAIYPANAVARNVLGLPGAWLAFQLNETFGVACYPLLAGWFVLAVMLFARKNWGAWTLRLLGWLVLVPSVAIVGHFLSAVIAERPLVGAGGNLGAWLAALLEARYQSMGTWALTASLLMLGFVLAFDVVLAALGRVMLRTGASIARLFERPTQDQRTAVRGLAPETPVAEVIIALDDYVDEDPVVEATAEEVIVPINHADAEATTVTAGASLSAALPIKRPTPQLQEEARFPDYELPPLTLLEDPAPFPYEEHDKVLREKAALLEKTFTDFHLNVKVVGINTGPVITQYEVALETGLRVNKVTRLADDLALNLSVPSVRIVAPIPGKNTVGVEIPNEHRANVRLKEIICMFGGKLAKSKIPLFIGKDTEGQPLVYDLAEMPHLLIAGRTGTGKSVCMNSIILSILMTRSPDDVKMIMIDPKMLELSEYGKIPHLMHPVVKDMKKAEAILAWAVDKMEERYDILSRAKVRSIASYNELSHEEILDRVRPVDEEDEKRVPAKMPYIVIFVDEMADLMMMMRKEVEGHIIRLAQKSRAAGIHLVVATQKPTVDVITGLIKSNLPARICFQVASKSDSRVVLDEGGADKLLGKGDMLFLAPGTSHLLRAQGTYASDREITHVVEHLECEPSYAEELVSLSGKGGGDGGNGGGFLEQLRARDEMYEQAIDVIVREGRGSTSLLQRALGIGYGRAARLVDFMYEDGIVGEYNGSQAREVLYKPDQWEAMKAQSGAA